MREQHIIERHPGTLLDYLMQLTETLNNPDLVRKSSRDANALLFSKWFDTSRARRYLVVLTISEDNPIMHWILTYYTARIISGGEKIWPTDA